MRYIFTIFWKFFRQGNLEIASNKGNLGIVGNKGNLGIAGSKV